MWINSINANKTSYWDKLTLFLPFVNEFIVGEKIHTDDIDYKNESI
jgi:hypothetical protein